MGKLNLILNEFGVDQNALVKKLDKGHINDTYIVEIAGEKQYVLQRINHEIFKNITGLINNILKVTSHLASKVNEDKKEKLLYRSLRMINIKSRPDQYYHKDPEGNYWRLYNFIDGSSYDMVDTPSKAFAAGKAFGKFQDMLADMDSNELVETIPDFHNMIVRYNTFQKTIKKNPAGRVPHVAAEITFVSKQIDELTGLQRLIDEGIIPKRITHNDTKINNILFDEIDIPLCIVDLDTVMPGSVLYDFGDAIRTATNTAVEDEADLSKIRMDLNLFKAYTKGYIEAARTFLTKAEVDNLALSARYIAFIMGLRFLTDYIDGDKYYKIKFEAHNLQRARAQFRLYESMTENYERMKEIINQFYGHPQP